MESGRVDQVEQGKQLRRIVLHGRSSEQVHVLDLQRAHVAGDGRLDVLEAVCLVGHHVAPRDLTKYAQVLTQHLIRSDENVKLVIAANGCSRIARGSTANTLAISTVVAALVAKGRAAHRRRRRRLQLVIRIQLSYLRTTTCALHGRHVLQLGWHVSTQHACLEASRRPARQPSRRTMLRACYPVMTPRLMAIGCVGTPTTVAPRAHRRKRDRIDNSGVSRSSQHRSACFAFATRLSTQTGGTAAAAAAACSGTVSWVWSVLCGRNETRSLRRFMGELQFAYELPCLLGAVIDDRIHVSP